ncbi:unnamed protein product, partial [Lymnaea stagnalis]
TGWAGGKCEISCHCKKQACDRSGHCNNGVPCSQGWFALACQYSDLGAVALQLDLALKDNDDSTCS